MPLPPPENFEEVLTILGSPGLVRVQEDGALIPQAEVPYDRATVRDIYTLEGERAPGAELGLYRMQTGIRAGVISGGLATLAWAGDGATADYPGITTFDVTGAFGLVLPTLDVDMAVAAVGERRYRQWAIFRGVNLPTAAMTLPAAAGRILLRGPASTNILFGHYHLVTVDYFTPLGFATVTVQDLGNTIPPLLLQLWAAGAAGSIAGIGSLNPYLYSADRVLFMPVRVDGQSQPTPADKGYTAKSGNGFDAAQDNRALITGASAKMLVSDSRAAEGLFGGTGDVTGSDICGAVAIRGANFSQHGVIAANAAAAVSFSSFSGLPDGSAIYGMTLCKQNFNPRPAGATALLNPAAAATEGWHAGHGWFWSLWKASPTGGAWAPANITLPVASDFFSMTAVATPNGA